MYYVNKQLDCWPRGRINENKKGEIKKNLKAYCTQAYLLKQHHQQSLILARVLYVAICVLSSPIHTNAIMNSYFYRLPRLWNSLPVIDLSQSIEEIKSKLKIFYGIIFLLILIIPLVTFITCVHAVAAPRLLLQTILTPCTVDK